MKRKERQHLKHNPVAEFVMTAQRYADTYARQITIAAITIIVIVLAAGAIIMVRQQTAARAEALLADAMVTLHADVLPSGTRGEGGVPAAAQLMATGAFPNEAAKLTAALPKLETAATTYPNTHAALVARYHLAASLAALGRHDEAIAAYEEVLQRAGDRNLYTGVARAGLAATQMQAGRFDQAIAGWKALAERPDAPLPADAILMELARAYVASGDTAEARRTFSAVVEEHPDSTYASEARMQIDSLAG